LKQKLLIILSFILLAVVLVGLNAASYVQKEKEPDSEFFPNRSTYNSGATGTRAFYELLSETGRKTTRWQESPHALLSSRNAPQTFVAVGPFRREFTETEVKDLLRWVAQGGKLVMIDREPPRELVKTTANWSISVSGEGEPPFIGIDPSDAKQMTEKTSAAIPVQPTVYTKNINAVQPSKFASSVIFERFSADDEQSLRNERIDAESDSDYSSDAAAETENRIFAPFIHLMSGRKNILVDVPYGSGQIVFLTDPFIVSNGGINLIDNAQIGINVAASREGLIAFDEYHQGFGTNNNRLLQYFSGTPVAAIFLQIVLLIALILFSQSRRFARALPENEPDRLSKLEYVSAMAELQQRTKAFDLAVENIYLDFKRRAARLVGADIFATSRQELAKLIAERAKLNEFEIAALMKKCEDIMHGEPTNKKEVLQIAARLRQIEEKLGLKRNGKTKI
jgi:hypothetical protein